MAEAPLYDPATHVDDDEVVRVELWCKCTAAFRQVDPVKYVRPQVEDFLARHSGDGHGSVSAAVALKEREARREGALRAIGRQDEFKPKKRDVPAGTTDWAKLAGSKKKG